MTIYVNGVEEGAGTLSEDTVDEGVTTLNADSNGAAGGYIHQDILKNEELIVATCTTTFDANSMTVAVGFGQAYASTSNAFYYRLYIDGNIVATEVLPSPATATNQVLVGTYACSGETVCKLVVWNSDQSATHSLTAYAQDDAYKLPFAIGVGSVAIS